MLIRNVILSYITQAILVGDLIKPEVNKYIVQCHPLWLLVIAQEKWWCDRMGKGQKDHLRLGVFACVCHLEKNKGALGTYVGGTLCREKLKINSSFYHLCYSFLFITSCSDHWPLQTVHHEKLEEKGREQLVDLDFVSWNDGWNWRYTEKCNWSLLKSNNKYN